MTEILRRTEANKDTAIKSEARKRFANKNSRENYLCVYNRNFAKQFYSMVLFNRFQLGNGLKVLVHEDRTTPLAVVNILYDIGARDEQPDKTGFAHLFEHLMFGGSVNVPNFDEPLQKAGGNNNAFTSNDITNYYDIVPANNLETVFWLESDRMLSLAFGKKSLEVQRKVVCEEFKEHYLNQPIFLIFKIMRIRTYSRLLQVGALIHRLLTVLLIVIAAN